MGIRTIQRKDEIRALVTARGRLETAELVAGFGISRVTARRYLAELEREGVLQRVYGGAVGTGPGGPAGFSFSEKAVRHLPEKKALARRALDQVREGETIFLDSGTTVLELARLIGAGRLRLTAATASLPAVMALLRNEQVEIMLIGGFLRRALLDLHGPFSGEEIARLSFTRAFLGVDGLSAGAGLTTTDPATAGLEEAVIARSSRVTILADHSKLGRVSLIPYGNLAAGTGRFCLLTGAWPAAGAEVNALRAHGLEVITVRSRAGSGRARANQPGRTAGAAQKNPATQRRRQ